MPVAKRGDYTDRRLAVSRRLGRRFLSESTRVYAPRVLGSAQVTLTPITVSSRLA